jgi:antitoxin component of MazEF toxin-antitoxin module
MKVDLIRIGNSRGIRIPKPVIEQCGFGDTAELRIEQDRLIIARIGNRDRTGKRRFDRLVPPPRTNSCSMPSPLTCLIERNGSGEHTAAR